MSIAPFVQKTFDIFSCPNYKEICDWGNENNTIVIKNIEAFSELVLPKYFKHSKYSSFTRQLHKYGFHKVTSNFQDAEFKHPYFVKDQPEIMVFIERKSKANKYCIEGHGHPCSENLSTAQYRHDEVTTLRNIDSDEEKLTVLEKRNADLISESNLVKNMIKEAVDHNNEMIHTMDTILNSAMSAIHSSRNDNLSNISDAVTNECKVATNSKPNFLETVKRMMRSKNK